jgi:hypothetical protein
MARPQTSVALDLGQALAEPFAELTGVRAMIETYPLKKSR